jgi:ribonuclease III
MSRPRIHDLLKEIFETKELVESLFEHEDLERFATEHALKIPLKNLAVVFTHKSFSHEFNVPHQEQLEFLGDAVLQLILTDELYKKFSHLQEGHLSKLRAALVNEQSLANIAKGLYLNELIIVGKGEFKKRLMEQDAVLADTLEALLAQIYRFQGLEFARLKFLSWLHEFIPSAFEENFLDQFDAKSKLQEKVLARFKKLPRYTAVEKGDGFEITLWINDQEVAKDIFSSKKNGEKELAKRVLDKELV